jgi:hypothetical protein
MKKQAGKKLTFSTETLRQLTSDDDLGQVVGGVTTTALGCNCSNNCTTAPTCGSPTLRCTTAIICG